MADLTTEPLRWTGRILIAVKADGSDVRLHLRTAEAGSIEALMDRDLYDASRELVPADADRLNFFGRTYYDDGRVVHYLTVFTPVVARCNTCANPPEPEREDA